MLCSLVKGNRTVLVNKVFAVFDGLILVLLGELRVGCFRIGSCASSPNEVCGVRGLIGAQNVQYKILCR